MKLKRKFGFWEVFCIAAGAMISSGLFVLPGIAFKVAGPGLVLAYGLAGVMVVPAMLAKAELASAMPKAGGAYFFVERSMGALPGTLAGVAAWLELALKSAFALIGIGVMLRFFWEAAPIWAIKSVAIAGCAVFTALNMVSTERVGRLQVVLVAGLLVILGTFVVMGFGSMKPANFEGFLAKGPLSILTASGMVFVSFGGLTKVASVAEEVRQPGRNIPAGMFAAAGVVTLLYVLVAAAIVGVLGPEELDGNLKPVAAAGGRLAGPAGVAVISIAAMLAFITTANGGILAASRSPLAMSRDGLLPEALGRVSQRYATPWVSVAATGGFMIAMIAALDIESLIKAASTMKLLLFALVSLSVVIMRRSRIQNYRPLFKAPGYPWLYLGGIVIYLGLIVPMGLVPLAVAAGFLCLGGLWYLLYVRARITRESALVYLVKGLAAEQMGRAGLEDELKHIALERDQVVHDRFDHLVRDCEVLDLPGPLRTGELLERVAQVLGGRLGMEATELLGLFEQRERVSSTVVHPGLAIPHVIVPGEGRFELVLARCRDGVMFSGQEQMVKVVFALAGTADERNYHLRVLMAIAHVVQEPDFMRLWLAAGDSEHLRDIILLSGRKRDHRPHR